jgi:hypothetical protein
LYDKLSLQQYKKATIYYRLRGYPCHLYLDRQQLYNQVLSGGRSIQHPTGFIAFFAVASFDFSDSFILTSFAGPIQHESALCAAIRGSICHIEYRAFRSIDFRIIFLRSEICFREAGFNNPSMRNGIGFGLMEIYLF